MIHKSCEGCCRFNSIKKASGDIQTCSFLHVRLSELANFHPQTFYCAAWAPVVKIMEELKTALVTEKQPVQTQAQPNPDPVEHRKYESTQTPKAPSPAESFIEQQLRRPQ